MQISKHIAKLIYNTESLFDKTRFAVKRKFNLFKPLRIQPYLTYGSSNQLYIKGRLLEDKNIPLAGDNDNIWRNIIYTIKRLESDEIPFAKLQISYEGKSYQSYTDREGYFKFVIDNINVNRKKLWHSAEIKLLEAPVPKVENIKASARIMVPPENCEYGIISDIDDTVLKTNAVNFLKMAFVVLFNNAKTRTPFHGVSAFYKALQRGSDGNKINPLFYVSSSPWNLYEFLMDFFTVHDIPPGPLLLKDYGIRKNYLFSKGHLNHKFSEIKQILESYPNLKFILIGDSGQQDPVIYQEVVKNFPDRIAAIYIRSTELSDRDKIVIKISEELKQAKVDMILVENTFAAAEDAVKKNLIPYECLANIEEKKEKDEQEDGNKVNMKSPQKVKKEVMEELHDENKKEEMKES